MVFEREEELLRRTESYDKNHLRSEADRSKSTRELMQMLGITAPNQIMARAAAVRCYGHVLQREEGNILKETLNFEVTGRRKKNKTKGYLEKNRFKL